MITIKQFRITKKKKKQSTFLFVDFLMSEPSG